MKIPCNIVRDLLPSYIDELCSEETKQQMAEHLGTCRACDGKYKEMKGELPEALTLEAEQVLAEELQPMKKIRKRHRIQTLALAVVLVAVVIIGGVLVVKGGRAGFGKGYTKGYVDATEENPDLLTMRVKAKSVGEVFSNLWRLMQKKWDMDENVRIALEKDQLEFCLQNMRLCLLDETTLYVVETNRGYGGNGLTVVVKRMDAEGMEFSGEVFRFTAFVDCMKELKLEWKEEMHEKDYFLRLNNEFMKQYSTITLAADSLSKVWVYKDEKLREYSENIKLEGYAAYCILDISTIGMEDDTDPVGRMLRVYVENK